ncbi:hypothetical protein ExPEC_0462 [Escherichia coli]|uniref:Uncharacterized protein n=1 Tax=Escherichia coli ACN001 TaxID=1311757 RepID=A0A140WYS4_ECOLX|nr:hypothetical protein J444_pB207 [Escherichia coli ACN001]KQL73524.1 hypothetical protein ExPEC_0462 [Escherichia coli]BDO58278.1 hypothetical protein TUM1886_53250 [Escherichia coli]GMM27045.1 hypothetical protein KTU0001_44700 [Escherichia coli]
MFLSRPEAKDTLLRDKKIASTVPEKNTFCFIINIFLFKVDYSYVNLSLLL